MPKKTRQEKILARLRRLEREQNPTEIPGQGETQTETPKISLELSSPNQPPSQSNKITTSDYSYVYQDLIKSLVFAALAVTFQIILVVFVLN